MRYPSPRTRALLLAIGLGMMLAAVPSREAAAQQFTGALQTGLSASRFVSESGASYDPLVGLTGGVGLGYDFGNGFIAQAEILYVIKGAATDAPIDGVESRVHFEYRYLEVPLLAIYRFETRGRFHPKLFAGPAVAWNHDARFRYRVRSGGPSFSQSDAAARSIDYSAVFGLGTEMELGTERLSLTGRLSLGLTDIRDQQASLRNAGVLLLLGIVF